MHTEVLKCERAHWSIHEVSNWYRSLLFSDAGTFEHLKHQRKWIGFPSDGPNHPYHYQIEILIAKSTPKISDKGFQLKKKGKSSWELTTAIATLLDIGDMTGSDAKGMQGWIGCDHDWKNHEVWQKRNPNDLNRQQWRCRGLEYDWRPVQRQSRMLTSSIFPRKSREVLWLWNICYSLTRLLNYHLVISGKLACETQEKKLTPNELRRSEQALWERKCYVASADPTSREELRNRHVKTFRKTIRIGPMHGGWSHQSGNILRLHRHLLLLGLANKVSDSLNVWEWWMKSMIKTFVRSDGNLPEVLFVKN